MRKALDLLNRIADLLDEMRILGGMGGGGGVAGPHISGAGVPVDGVAGTGVGTAAKGWLYTDTNTGTIYHQQGVINNVAWVPIISI